MSSIHIRGDYSTNIFQNSVCACSKRTGTAARESLLRDHSDGLTSPALHACGSASPFRARCCHRNKNRYTNQAEFIAEIVKMQVGAR